MFVVSVILFFMGVCAMIWHSEMVECREVKRRSEEAYKNLDTKASLYDDLIYLIKVVR